MFGNHVLGFQHLGLPITDLNQSKTFYEQLGFHEIMATVLETADGNIAVSMMELNGFVLELYQLPAAALEEISQRGHGHIDHFALDVDDIQAVFKMAKENDLTLLEDAPVFLPFWDKGVYYFNILGPDGEKVEFNQRVKDEA